MNRRSTDEELQGRDRELWRANDDLSNLLASISFPIIMVGRDLRVRRYTPEADATPQGERRRCGATDR